MGSIESISSFSPRTLLSLGWEDLTSCCWSDFLSSKFDSFPEVCLCGTGGGGGGDGGGGGGTSVFPIGLWLLLKTFTT